MSESQIITEREEWRTVSGSGGALQVSSLGRAMRMFRSGQTGRRGKVGPFTPLPPKNSIWVQGRVLMDVSRLVLETFVGPCPDGMECCHQDDDRSNNRLGNLRWDTHANNVRDGYRNGAPRKRMHGVQTGHAKLTDGKVVLARLLRTSWPKTFTHESLATLLGITRAAMSRALTRKTWRHV